MAEQADSALENSRGAALACSLLVSVVICTRNRADFLAKTIKSLQEQSFPAQQYEILVIDNASSDNTADVVNWLASRSNVQIRYIHEARLGVSYARNSGMSAARGEFIAYIDDDEEAAPSWLQGVLDAFSVEPEPGIVCGPVNPAWERQPPKWIIDDIECYYSIFLPGESASFVDHMTWFPEGNSAFRTDLLRAIGGFSTDLGRKGDSLLSGECKRVEKRFRELGQGVYYQPSMSVSHFIPASRMNLKWLSNRCYFQGISDAIHHLESRHYSLFGSLRLLAWYTFDSARSAASLAYDWCRYKLLGSPRLGLIKYVQSRVEFFTKFGWLYGFARQSFGRFKS